MKGSIISIMLSMMAAIPLVNASAEDLPISNQSTQNANLKDSVKERSNGLSRLIKFLMRTGEDDQLTENLSSLIGLTGSPRIKGHELTLPRANGKERRECTIVFSDQAENATSEAQRPSCLYIQHKTVSGHDSEALYYRFSVDGKLEYAAANHAKYDDDGKIIAGSGVFAEKDVNSPAVQKAFKAEIAYWTKEWLKKEEKELAKAKASAASDKDVPAAPAASPAQ